VPRFRLRGRAQQVLHAAIVSSNSLRLH
jgi:hypothetical protein